MEEIKLFYQNLGKEVVDVLFDKGYFAKDISRSDMQGVEDLIAYYIQIQSESAVKLAELNRKFKKDES